MVAVTELGYMGLGVKNLERWKHFASQILGLEVVDEGEADRSYLRMDYWHHRFVLHSDPSDDLMYLGFRVAGPDEFGEMQRQLSAAGIKVRVGSEEEASERHVLQVMKLEDPDGHPVEIFHGPEIRKVKPFYPGRRMHGRFKTDAGGLGHCIIRERDTEAAYRFYELLGMRGSIEYKFKTPKGVVCPVFMHCNERDHSVAFGIGQQEKRLNHIMIEVDSIDDVGLTHDIVRREKIPLRLTLGKHANDHMFSFYFRTPSGWMVEYGCGARPASQQSEFYYEDTFGHHPEAGDINTLE